MELEWSEPPPPGLGILEEETTGGDNNLAQLWAELLAENALDFTDGGFCWTKEELRQAGELAAVSRTTGVPVNEVNMAELEKRAGITQSLGGKQ